jgi:hypothetical protein
MCHFNLAHPFFVHYMYTIQRTNEDIVNYQKKNEYQLF